MKMYLPAELIKAELQSQGYRVDDFISDDDIVQLSVTRPRSKRDEISILFDARAVDVSCDFLGPPLLSLTVNDPDLITKIHNAIASHWPR
jgi:hypothetical protein